MDLIIFNSSYPNVKCGIGDFTAKLVESIYSYTNYSVTVVTSKNEEITQLETAKTRVMPIVDIWERSSFFRILPKVICVRPKIVIAQYPSVMPNGGGELTYWLPLYSKIFFWPTKVLFLVHEFANTLPRNRESLGKAFKFADEIIVFNSADKMEISRLIPTVAGKIRMSFIGSNFDSVNPSQTEIALLRRKLGISKSTKLIGYFGFLYGPDKGFDYLLEAFARICKDLVDVKLLVIGQKLDTKIKYHQDLSECINRLNLSNSIVWTNYLDKSLVPVYLHLPDVMVLPFREGVIQNNTTVLASITQGLPVITTYVRGVTPNLFKNGRNVVLVPPDNPEKLAIAIKRVLENSDFATNLRSEALNLAKKFTWGKVVKNIIQ